MQQSKNLFKQLSDNAVGLPWLISVFTLALSVFYDFSYLGALNLTFGEVHTSISDHIRSAIIWLPWGAILIGLSGLALRMFQQFDNNESTPIEFDNSLTRTKILKMFHRESLLTTFTWALLAFGTVLTLRSSSANYIVFFLGWLSFSTRLGMRIPAKVYFSSPLRFALFFGPLIVSCIGIFGSLSAELALNERKPIWRVSYRQTGIDTSTSVDVILLRRFSSTTIIATKDKKIIVIPESTVISSERISPETSYTIAEKLRLEASKVVQLLSNK